MREARKWAEWPAFTDKDRARFLSKIALPNEDGCCLWTAATNGNGYGHFDVGGRRSNGGTTLYAHRLSYALWIGPIPDATEVDHLCRNHSCVTPDHLRIATGKQNQEHRGGARVDSSTGVLGVTREVRRGRVRWVTQVGHNGRRYRFGRFDTIEEAEAAVIAGRLSLFTHNDADRAVGAV